MTNAAQQGLHSLTDAVRLAIHKSMQGMNGMMPCQVKAVSIGSNRVTVQPLISVLDNEGNQTGRDTIASVPIHQLSSGGFIVKMPVAVGDLGWIKACDRDISLFLQTLKAAPPNTDRMHSFSDCVFYPDCMFSGVSVGSNAGKLTLQNLAGTVFVALSNTEVTIKSTTKVTIDTPLTEITGQLIAGTNTAGNQTASFNGNITTTGNVIAGTVSLRTHTHSGVQAGGGNTAIPNT